MNKKFNKYKNKNYLMINIKKIGLKFNHILSINYHNYKQLIKLYKSKNKHNKLISIPHLSIILFNKKIYKSNN
jgi:hypothetical protein